MSLTRRGEQHGRIQVEHNKAFSISNTALPQSQHEDGDFGNFALLMLTILAAILSSSISNFKLSCLLGM